MQNFVFLKPLHLQTEGDVFGGRHVGKKSVALKHHPDAALLRLGMRDVFAVDEDAARIWRLKTGKAPQQRRFAAARGTEQRDELPLFDRKGKILENLGCTEMLAKAFHNNIVIRLIHDLLSFVSRCSVIALSDYVRAWVGRGTWPPT